MALPGHANKHVRTPSEYCQVISLFLRRKLRKSEKSGSKPHFLPCSSFGAKGEDQTGKATMPPSHSPYIHGSPSSIHLLWERGITALSRSRGCSCYSAQVPPQNDKKALNTAQKQAALHTEGPFFMVAGAGAGKTRTIAYRTAHLLNKGVPARQVLTVTFTNKAASEMRDRIRGLLPAEQGGPEPRGTR